MRTFNQVTDDEIVSAIAGFGLGGMDYDSDADMARIRAFTSRIDDLSSTLDEVADALLDRVLSMPERLVDVDGARIALTLEEWGRQLAGKRAEEIAAALLGADA